jgi:hypothetical protein
MAKRHALLQLEDALHLSAQDLKYASSTIQADLDRFQRQKVADLREMAISMARSHREWCMKVCTVALSGAEDRSLMGVGRTWRFGRKQRKRLRRSLNTLIRYPRSGQVPRVHPLLAPRLRGEIRQPRSTDGDRV